MSKQIRSTSLKKTPSRTLQTKAYRVIARDLMPLSLEGSLMLGGRYNPPYQFGAIYCGWNEETCWAEIEKRLEGPVKRARFNVIPIRVHLNKVLDLTDPTVLSELKVERQDLTHPTDYTLTRRIANMAREAGFEAILAPSSASPGTIIAIFSDRLDTRSKLAVVKRRKPHS